MRHRTVVMVLALVSLVLAGCVEPPSSPPEGEIAFETVEQGSNSGVTERSTEVVRTDSQWRSLWAEHTSPTTDDSGPPAVDFDESIVLAAFKGESPNGCHLTEIQNVSGTSEGEILVEGVHVRINASYCTQQITHPFHMVTIDRYDAEVTFEMREETRQASERSGGGTEDSQDTTRRSSHDEQFTDIGQGQDSGVEEQRTVVVRNASAWSQLWREHDRDDEPRPEVDFDERMVLAIFKGESPNGCHGAEIENLSAGEDELVVHGAFVVIEGAVCPDAITYPFHIVETDRYDGPVRFDVENETRQA